MINPKLTTQQYMELANPDKVDNKTVGGVGKVYMGYAKNDSPADEDLAWNVIEINIQADGNISYLWAGGINRYAVSWSGRTTHTYKTLR